MMLDSALPTITAQKDNLQKQNKKRQKRTYVFMIFGDYNLVASRLFRRNEFTATVGNLKRWRTGMDINDTHWRT